MPEYVLVTSNLIHHIQADRITLEQDAMVCFWTKDDQESCERLVAVANLSPDSQVYVLTPKPQ